LTSIQGLIKLSSEQVVRIGKKMFMFIMQIKAKVCLKNIYHQISL